MAAPPLLGNADLAGRSVHLRRDMPSSIVDVWRALTEPGGLERWLGRVDGGWPQPGGRFAIWHDESTCSHHTVTRWVPEVALALTWEFPGEEESHVLFTIQSAGSDTVLSVMHQGLDDPVNYAAGWHIHLDYLGAHLVDDPQPFALFWDEHEALAIRYAAAGRG